MAATPAAQPEINLKMVMVPAMMLGLRFLKLDLSEYVNLLRVTYLLSTLFTTGVYVYLMQLARRSPSKETVDVIDKVPGDASKRRTLTIGDYDAEEAFKKIKSAAVAVCVVSFIHYKWGSPMPLLLQSFMQPFNLTDDPLVNIHIFKKPADGKFKRPFKVANPLADLLEGGGGSSEDDAAAKKTK